MYGRCQYGGCRRLAEHLAVEKLPGNRKLYVCDRCKKRLSRRNDWLTTSL